MMKIHGSSVEFLPHDVVELILERLPVKSLLSFKAVSKQWKSTINDSRRFQQRHLIRRTQSRDPHIFFMSYDRRAFNDVLETKSFVLGSSIAFTLKFPFPFLMVCCGTCDGLLCMYDFHTTTYIVVNPTTKWHHNFPLPLTHMRTYDRIIQIESDSPTSDLGFGKDKFRGTYKPVWLHNSSKYDGVLENATTCEVFDFTTNAWRFVRPASPYRILDYQKPVNFDGSLHWLTECEETKVVSFDLHTETFQDLCKAPFANVVRNPHNVNMSVLDNRLCVSESIWPTQVIWSFESSGCNKTWKKMCCIDITKTSRWFMGDTEPEAILPVAFVEKNKLLLHGCKNVPKLVIYDLLTKSSHSDLGLVISFTTIGYCSSYFESLLSV